MEINNSQPITSTILEQIIAEIVSDPEIQAEMLKMQPIDIEKN